MAPSTKRKIPREDLIATQETSTPVKPVTPAAQAEGLFENTQSLTISDALKTWSDVIDASIGKTLVMQDYLPGGVFYNANIAPKEIAQQYGSTFTMKPNTSKLFKYQPVTPEIQKAIDTMQYGSPQGKEEYFKPGGLGETYAKNAGIPLNELKNQYEATGYAVDAEGKVYLQNGNIISNFDKALLKPTVGLEGKMTGSPIYTADDPAAPVGTRVVSSPGSVVSPPVLTTSTSQVTQPTTTTSTTAGVSAANQLAMNEAAATKKAATDLLKEQMKFYFTMAGDEKFVSELSDIIDQYVKDGYDPATISVMLPSTKPYQIRFSGNEGRIKAGLSAYSPKDYLTAESVYNETLRTYGLEDLATREMMGLFIGGLTSPDEIQQRVVNVYDRIRNADPALKSEFERVKELSQGQISETAFAKALLTGKTGAEELKKKIATAEIASEARVRGLNVNRAQELQQLGVTREQARAGFEQVTLAQPVVNKLSQIYDKTTPDALGLQKELESEQFLGLQSQRRKRLAEQEQTAFMGQSGTAGAQSLARRRTGSY